jgi:sugar phosphate isomerase/epimerase
MQPGLSTHVFLPQHLHTGLLDAMHRSGATAIEIFAARHHFDYTDRSAVRDLAAWFRDSGLTPILHQPLYPDAHWSRHVAPTLNLIDPEKSRRIDTMDEIKRAIESAEQIPFRSVVLHLGMKDDRWDTRALENSLTAIEHLKAFATPLGVQLLLENLQNEITTPEHLLEILRIGHFDTVGVCLDVGHAHLTDFQNPGAGIDAAFELLKPRIAELHLHDNSGRSDEHLWPSTAAPAPVPNGIDWANIHRHTSTLPPEIPGILEIAHTLNDTADSAQTKASTFFDTQLRLAEQEPPELH